MCGYVSYTEEMPLSGAERQRRHREKIKKDPKKLQQYKLKKHEFYLKTKKSIEFMNDREQHDVENDEKQSVVNPAVSAKDRKLRASLRTKSKPVRLLNYI